MAVGGWSGAASRAGGSKLMPVMAPLARMSCRSSGWNTSTTDPSGETRMKSRSWTGIARPSETWRTNGRNGAAVMCRRSSFVETGFLRGCRDRRSRLLGKQREQTGERAAEFDRIRRVERDWGQIPPSSLKPAAVFAVNAK